MSEIVERLRRANGEAGEVEVETYVDSRGDPYPEPIYQHFIAQAGPYDSGTPVVVMSEEEAGKVRAEIERLEREVAELRGSPPSPEPLGWVVVRWVNHRPVEIVSGSLLQYSLWHPLTRDWLSKMRPNDDYTVEPVGQRGRTDD